MTLEEKKIIPKINPVMQTRVKLSDLSEPEIEAFDKEKFASLLRDMKGKYSVREFADRTGLSLSFLSKAINCSITNPPTKRTMLKLSTALVEVPIPFNELLEAAGYSLQVQEKEEEINDPVEATQPKRTMTAAVTEYYGWELIDVKYELERALLKGVLKGNVTSRMNSTEGYVTVTDEESGQVYVGIPAYCRYQEGAAAVVFAAIRRYQKLTDQEGAEDKIFYILTDREDIYQSFLMMQECLTSKATAVLYTPVHRSFEKGELLNGSGVCPVGLLLTKEDKN